MPSTNAAAISRARAFSAIFIAEISRSISAACTREKAGGSEREISRYLRAALLGDGRRDAGKSVPIHALTMARGSNVRACEFMQRCCFNSHHYTMHTHCAAAAPLLPTLHTMPATLPPLRPTRFPLPTGQCTATVPPLRPLVLDTRRARRSHARHHTRRSLTHPP